MKYSTGIRDAQNDALAAKVGAAPVLEILGAGGEVIATGTLPERWLAGSVNGQIGLAEPWMVRGAERAGSGAKGASFRISGNGEAIEGTFSDENGGGEMRAKVNAIAQGQTVRVESFDIVRGNAQ